MMNFINPSEKDLRYCKREFKPVFLKDGVIDLAHLLHEFQSLASFQVSSLGMGEQFEKENHFMYVVMRYKGYFLKAFRPEERYTLVTYPLQASGVVMMRYAYILDSNEEAVFYLISLWIMMDDVNRRIRSTKPFQIRLKERLPDIDNIEPLSKEKLENFSLDGLSFSYLEDYLVKSEDIDSNQHMNNTIYARIAQNALPLKEIEEFTINFEKECFLQERLSLFLAQEKEEYIIKGEKEDSSLSFKMKMKFQ